MRVMVTGGRGFIGKAVCDELERRGYTPVLFDRAEGGDVMNPWTLVKHRADHVIHLAGVLGTHELFDHVDDAIDVNIKGTVNVLEWCLWHDAGYTGILMPDVFPSVYTATKVSAWRFAEAWHHNFDVPVSHVRAFNAFGPGQKHGHGHPQKIIPTFATAAWAGEPVPIWGDGLQTVDLIHTSDLARMLCDAINFGDCEVFDGGTGIPLRVNDVATMVIEAAGSSSALRHLPMRRGERPTEVCAHGEGWRLLGWSPEFRSADLVDTVKSYAP